MKISRLGKRANKACCGQRIRHKIQRSALLRPQRSGTKSVKVEETNKPKALVVARRAEVRHSEKSIGFLERSRAGFVKI
jgi:hypothetical protein